MKIFCVAFSFLLLPWFEILADDWPIFRGPDSNGISSESGWMAKDKAPIAWTAEVGLGYSAATVSNGQVYITGHDGNDTDRVFCFDEATGKQLWVYSYPQPKGDLYFQGGTTGTVTAEGNRVYHVAREGQLFCLDAVTGSNIWTIDLNKDEGYTKPTWGFTGAPLPSGNRLFVTAGEAGLALNKEDGSVIWKSKNQYPAGYATPYLFKRDGRELLIFTNKNYYNCVEAETGKIIWEVKWMTRYGVNAADPIVSGSHIFISSGYGKGATLLKWDGTGSPSTVWKSRDMKTQMNAAILIDGHLYGIDGNERQDGTCLKCMELATGKTLWEEESIGHGTVSVADGNLIVLTEKGELQIARVSTGNYTPYFSQSIVKPKVWTVPVFANGRIYCRNAAGQLAVVNLKKQ